MNPSSPITDSPIPLKQPLHPDQTQVDVDIVFTEALDTAILGRGVPEIEQAVEIPLYHYIAKIHRHRSDQAQLIFVPKGVGDVSYPDLEHVGPANLETCPATAAMNGVEVSRNGMAVVTEGANDDVNALRPSGAGSRK